MSNTQDHQPCPPWKKRLIYAGATIAATAGTLITWYNNTQEDQLDTSSSPNKAFLSLLYSAVAPCSWYVFCALELTEDECNCHKKPNNQADNQDQIGSINDPDIEDPQTQATEISSSQNYFQKVAKYTLLIGHVGFLISAIYSPIILYQDIDNSLDKYPFNLDEKLGSANYIKTILNLFLINILSAMNFLVYKNFGYKDLKSLITNKSEDQTCVLPSKMLQQIIFLMLFGGIAPGVMLSGSAISMQDLCVIFFFGWPEIHLHRDHLPLVDKFLKSKVCRREPLIKNGDLESQLNETQDDAWIQDAAAILGDSNEDKSPIASLSFCAKILCLLYGLAHASDDFYAFTSQSMHPNLEQRSIYKSTLLFFLGAGALFEVLIGALERSEQLATNDKPAIEPQIVQPGRNIARRRNLRRANLRARPALALAAGNPLFGNNAGAYAQLNPLSQGAQI
jgi:hypothetical protein